MKRYSFSWNWIRSIGSIFQYFTWPKVEMKKLFLEPGTRETTEGKSKEIGPSRTLVKEPSNLAWPLK